MLRHPAADRIFYLASELGDFSLIWLLLAAADGVVVGGEMDSKFDLESITVQIEHDIDENKNEGKFCFVMPGESILNAYLHVARTKCRTAERRLITMRNQYAIADNIMAFINRLSDWLFVEATKK